MHISGQETGELGSRFVAAAHETRPATNFRLFEVKDLTTNKLFLADTGVVVSVIPHDPNNLIPVQVETLLAARCTDVHIC